MADKTREIEDRVDRLENRLKATFIEIEKRFEQLKNDKPFTVEDRIQEIEDLLLLVHLELTKLKEQKSMEFELMPTGVPDVSERLNKLEQQLSSKEFPALAPEAHPDLDERLARIEERLEGAGPKLTVKSSLTKEFSDIEKRLNDLERRKSAPSARVESSVLDDVKKILSS